MMVDLLFLTQQDEKGFTGAGAGAGAGAACCCRHQN